jgi:DMSO/TMAO reductase YedYZ heme-binding membrane subunit
MVKADVTEPAIYALLVAFLLGYRLVAKVKDSRRRAARGGRAPLPQPRANA